MKKLIAGLGAGALLLASACYVAPTRAVVRYGYGGSGVDLDLAQDVCQRTALGHGWRWMRATRMEVTGPYTARIRFVADGIPFRRHVTCFYNANSNFATLR